MRINIIVLVCMLLGCTRGDPPCPPGAREVYLQEADEALGRKAKRLAAEGNDRDEAITFNCGYDRRTDGRYRTVGQVTLVVADVVWCLGNMVKNGIALNQCLAAGARSKFTGQIVGDQTVETMIQIASKVECKEFSREVDIEAEKHGLERNGPGDWVPVTIWAVIQMADKAMTPAMGPAMFMIIPRRGGAEEACVDVSTDTPKRCTADGDCLPPGAEDPNAGGILVPDLTSGAGAGSGDFP